MHKEAVAREGVIEIEEQGIRGLQGHERGDAGQRTTRDLRGVG